jgi:hypothetical protein
MLWFGFGLDARFHTDKIDTYLISKVVIIPLIKLYHLNSLYLQNNRKKSTCWQNKRHLFTPLFLSEVAVKFEIRHLFRQLYYSTPLFPFHPSSYFPFAPPHILFLLHLLFTPPAPLLCNFPARVHIITIEN